MNVRSNRAAPGWWLRCALVALAPLLLAACGGGGGGGQVASGGIVGTGISIGSVGSVSAIGPGTLTVNGVRFATKAAAVNVNGVPGSEAALKVGQVVTVRGQTLPDGTATAQTIDARVEVSGVVSGVDAAARAFTVLGQQVRTDQLTVFAGGTFGTLLNQFVEVSGFRAAPGEVLATRVEIRANGGAVTQVEITGTVAAFDAVGRAFMIGAQAVDFSQIGTAFLPAGLANGVVVEVHGTTGNAVGRLIASDIRVLAPAFSAPENSEIEIEGVITDFAGLASFRVNGQSVDGRSAAVTGGTAATVANGARVEVEGRLTQGVVVASKIEIEQESDIALDATLDAVDAAGITLAGQRVTVTPTTQFEDRSAAAVRDFGLAVLRVGDRVQVNALRGPAGLVATQIVRVDGSAPSPGSDVTVKIEGTITNFASVANFTVGAQVVNAASAHIEGGFAADLAIGRRVEVEGVLSGAVMLATRVVLQPLDTPSTQAVTVEGSITAFVSRSNFRVSGQLVDATNAAFEGGTAADLRNDRNVSVDGVLAGGVVTASKVAFRSVAPATLEIEGAIATFSSVANFTVAGQAIDASSARFSNGTAADLATGRVVHVTGPVVGGVLRATSIEIKDAPAQTEVEVRGAITNFVSVSNFTVASRRIDASAANIENGSAAMLANGVQVEVGGKLVGAVLVADKVSFE